MSTPTVTNGAIGVHHTATVDTPWDGPAAVAAMPNDASVLKYCHAWVDSSKPADQKGSYKFPHHKTDGGPANLAGCRNGLARLANSDIPAADKPGVERHLRAHLKDGGGDDNDADDRWAPLILGRHRMRNKTGRDWFAIRNAVTKDVDKDKPEDEGEKDTAAGDGVAVIYIYDEIGGGGWFSDGVSASDFVQALAEIKNTSIDLHINSPGGDVFDAVAIFNALRRHPANVTVYVDGLAASAASFIAQAGDKIVVERNAQFMVHDAQGICLGNAADMSKMVDLLNKASDNIADIYAQRSGVDATTWRAVMREEAWYSAAEAVVAGLADEVGDKPDVDDERLTAMSRFDLRAFGYRYGSRQEAPDPVSVRRAVVTGHASNAPVAVSRGEVNQPVEDLSVVPVGSPASREREPVLAMVPPVPFMSSTTATVPVTWTVPPVAAVPVVVEAAKSTSFDPEVFRAAIRAAVNGSA